jgi:hypothetical protein
VYKKKLPWWRSPWVIWPAKTVGTLAVVGVLVLFGWFWWKGVPELYRNPDGTVNNTPVGIGRSADHEADRGRHARDGAADRGLGVVHHARRVTHRDGAAAAVGEL